MPLKYYIHDGPFELECGGVLPELTIAYHTYGHFTGDNAVWVCHALTANSDVADWWPHTVEAGRFLDPAHRFVVCANIIGSHYGTTGPLHINPATGDAWYGGFPFVTIRDMARAHLLLARHLGVERVQAAIGSSIGGFQALEMALLAPEFVGRLVLIATSAKTSPWCIAFNESQRMAIEADATWDERAPDAGRAGMMTARSIGLLSYRGSSGYNATQAERDGEEGRMEDFRAASYQRYQGEKLARRYNAYSYHLITRAFDSHNVGRGRGDVERVLATVSCPTLVVGITTDIIFPVEEQRFLCDRIHGARLEILESEFGHDGFLVEHDKLNTIIKPFIEKK
ncbi:MAG: homoserine O-acetyltransferase [Rikenellaceae bacterium]|nr:homoserine O-acetyltransferase [Rikenellaceae bacterium]MCL2693367.1 homoserine O-acetyltransferase [Rikenellaceae bacterium]